MPKIKVSAQTLVKMRINQIEKALASNISEERKNNLTKELVDLKRHYPLESARVPVLRTVK